MTTDLDRQEISLLRTLLDERDAKLNMLTTLLKSAEREIDNQRKYITLMEEKMGVAALISNQKEYMNETSAILKELKQGRGGKGLKKTIAQEKAKRLETRTAPSVNNKEYQASKRKEGNQMEEEDMGFVKENLLELTLLNQKKSTPERDARGAVIEQNLRTASVNNNYSSDGEAGESLEYQLSKERQRQEKAQKIKEAAMAAATSRASRRTYTESSSDGEGESLNYQLNKERRRQERAARRSSTKKSSSNYGGVGNYSRNRQWRRFNDPNYSS